MKMVQLKRFQTNFMKDPPLTFRKSMVDLMGEGRDEVR